MDTGLSQRRSRVPGLWLLLVFSLTVLDVPSARAQGDSQPPTIVGRTPSPGWICQALGTNITATFSESIQPASISFVLQDSANTTLPASVSYDDSTHTATLHPSAALNASEPIRLA